MSALRTAARAACLALLACAAAALPARAWFEDSDVGARPLGLGRAYSAIADDASALYWNPAGLAGLARSDLVLVYARPYAAQGLHTSYGSVARPLKQGTVAFSWNHVGVSDALGEDMFTLGAAREVYSGAGGLRVSLGAAVKLARLSFPSYVDPESQELVDFGSCARVTADAGMLVRVNQRLSLGGTLRNLGSPEFALDRAGASGATELPSLFQVGAAYRWDEESTVAVDLEKVAPGKVLVNFGGEIWFYDGFAMRVGMTGPSATGGVSIKSKKFLVDLGFMTNEPLGISYRAGLRVPFGKREARP
jgi:hypothetical protein